MNRAFGRYCIRCGRSQANPAASLSSLDYWRKMAEPRDLPAEVPKEIPAPVTVAELETIRFPRRDESIAWSIVDGIILLHQGSGGIAAIDAFGDQRSQDHDSEMESPPRSAVIWEIAEQTAFPAPLSWQFSKAVDRAYIRPFPPTASSDHQYAVFATPYACAVLRMATLPGWAVHPGSALRVLVSLGGQHDPEWTLAAPPVMLEQRSPKGEIDSAIGLLFAHRPSGRGADPAETTYYWKVVDLRPSGGSVPDILFPLDPECRLPFRGACCQVVASPGRESPMLTGLVFATPSDLWVGMVRFPHRHQPLNLSVVKRMDRSGDRTPNRIRLAAEVESRNRFHWERFLLDPSRGAEEGAQLVLWCGEEIAHGRGDLDAQYQLLSLAWPESSSASGPPREIHASVHSLGTERIVPVGVGSQGKSFFLKGAHGELFSHQHPNNSTTEHSSFLRHVTEAIVGMTSLDPLVIAVAGDALSHSLSLCVRSLRNTKAPQLNWGPFRLAGEPLYWGGSLFICERNEQGLTVRRIPLPTV